MVDNVVKVSPCLAVVLMIFAGLTSLKIKLVSKYYKVKTQ